MDKLRSLKLIIPLVVISFLLACSRSHRLPETRLVVLVSVDQFWYPYIARYGQYFTGGFKKLIEEGALFDQARYNFAVTETAPGHATLVSGVQPARHGIIANSWYDHKSAQEEYCVADSYYGLSPRNMRVTSLPDWIKSEFPEGRVISVSGKDRTAILMAGRKADIALWYSRESGKFETSSFYQVLPGEIEGDDENNWAGNYFGELWNPLSETEMVFRAVDGKVLSRGVLEANFPYPLGKMSIMPDEKLYKSVYQSPFIDELTWRITKDLIVNEQLGTREDVMDYLAIGFSALDTVGHVYGPDSPEALDVLLRLDRILAELFQLLQDQVALENTLVVLTSDHGVQPFPEVSRNPIDPKKSLGQNRRANSVDVACVQKAGVKINETLGIGEIWLADLVLDKENLRKHRVSRTKVDAVVRESLEDCAAIDRVWTRDELLFSSDVNRPLFSLYKNSLAQGRGPDYFIQQPEGFLLSWPGGTSHGTPYNFDRHVPVFVMGAGITGRRIAEPLDMVDVAPTIASLLGVDVPGFVDGRNVSKFLFEPIS